MRPRTTIRLPKGFYPRARRVRVMVRVAARSESSPPPGPASGVRLELQTYCSHQFIPEIIVRADDWPDSLSAGPAPEAAGGVRNRVRILTEQQTSNRKQL